ncbi:hypothetical protein MMC13_000440 [Lambiella insularis]|nr:hypothetical protein [Lambiella insularis]
MTSNQSTSPRRRSSLDKFKDWVSRPFAKTRPPKDRSHPPISYPTQLSQRDIKPGYATLSRADQKQETRVERRQDKKTPTEVTTNVDDFLRTATAPRANTRSVETANAHHVAHDNRPLRKPAPRPRTRSAPRPRSPPKSVSRTVVVPSGQAQYVHGPRDPVRSIHGEIMGTGLSRERSRSSSYGSTYSDFKRLPDMPPMLRHDSVMKKMGKYSQFSKDSLEKLGLDVCTKCDARPANLGGGISLCDSCENLAAAALCSICRQRAPNEHGICLFCENIEIDPCRLCGNPEARHSTGLCAECEKITRGRPPTTVQTSHRVSRPPPLPAFAPPSDALPPLPALPRQPRTDTEPFPDFYSSADARRLFDPCHPAFFAPGGQHFDDVPPSPPLKDKKYLSKNPHLASRPGHGLPHADPWGTLHQPRRDSAVPSPLNVQHARRLSDIHPADRESFCVSPISPPLQAKFDAFSGVHARDVSPVAYEPRGRPVLRPLETIGLPRQMPHSAEARRDLSGSTLASLGAGEPQPKGRPHVKFAEPPRRR